MNFFQQTVFTWFSVHDLCDQAFSNNLVIFLFFQKFDCENHEVLYVNGGESSSKASEQTVQQLGRSTEWTAWDLCPVNAGGSNNFMSTDCLRCSHSNHYNFLYSWPHQQSHVRVLSKDPCFSHLISSQLPWFDVNVLGVQHL